MSDLPEGVEIEFLGTFCPVQAEGSVNGRPLYFRARGTQWSLGIGKDPILAPDWRCRIPYEGDGPYAAGWIDQDEALKFISQAVTWWREGKPSFG
ncbi:hypothetical protein [Roseivivax sp. CAU 1761]